MDISYQEKAKVIEAASKILKGRILKALSDIGYHAQILYYAPTSEKSVVTIPSISIKKNQEIITRVINEFKNEFSHLPLEINIENIFDRKGIRRKDRRNDKIVKSYSISGFSYKNCKAILDQLENKQKDQGQLKQPDNKELNKKAAINNQQPLKVMTKVFEPHLEVLKGSMPQSANPSDALLNEKVLNLQNDKQARALNYFIEKGDIEPNEAIIFKNSNILQYFNRDSTALLYLDNYDMNLLFTAARKLYAPDSARGLKELAQIHSSLYPFLEEEDVLTCLERKYLFFTDLSLLAEKYPNQIEGKIKLITSDDAWQLYKEEGLLASDLIDVADLTEEKLELILKYKASDVLSFRKEKYI